MFEDGDRQILRLLLPGETAGLCGGTFTPFTAITPCLVANVSLAEISQAQADDSDLAAELAGQLARQQRMAEELLVSLGHRRALQRMGFLICELFHRQGAREGVPCELPLSQTDLAELMGLSAVHVNRTLQVLRCDGFIQLSRRQMTIPDFGRLADLSGFKPDYLQTHLGSLARNGGHA